MYIKEQKAEDTNRKDLIFKRVPIYIEDIKGYTIYPSQSVVKELRKFYNQFVGPNNHENTWDQFSEFYIMMNEVTPNSAGKGAIKYMLTQKDKMDYLGQHVYMDIVLLKSRWYQPHIKNGVVRGVFNSIRLQNESNEGREIIVIDSDNETEIDNDSESDDEFVFVPRKKRKLIESDSESDDEFTTQTKRPKMNNSDSETKPDWLIQSVNCQEYNEMSDSIYYGLVFIFLFHDKLSEMSLKHKKELIKLLFKPNDVTYKRLLITLYDIGKNYSFLQNVMKNQFYVFIDSFHQIKSNQFSSIYRDEKELNINYLKLYIDCRRATKPSQKNVLDGMLYWLYNTYTVNENETYYFGNPEERIKLESESESESESEYEYKSESESEDEFVRSQENDIKFVLGVSQNIKNLLKGKGKHFELYDKMTKIVSKYHVQNLSSNNKEAKKQIIDCIFDQDMDVVVEYAYSKFQQEL